MISLVLGYDDLVGVNDGASIVIAPPAMIYLERHHAHTSVAY